VGSGYLDGYIVTGASDGVTFVKIYQLGFVIEQFSFGVAAEGTDDNLVPYIRLMGSRAIN